MPRYVLAGVTGRVGRAAADALLSRREYVTVVVRDPARREEWAAKGATVAVGSLDDAAFLARTLSGANAFYTLLPENVDPFAFHAQRRRIADAIADGVRRSGVPHVVMLSALPAHLGAGNGPAAGLHYLEAALKREAKVFTAIRAMSFQDNIASVIPLAREAGIYPLMIGEPDTPLPLVATRDVGRIVATELSAPHPRSDVVDVFGPPCTAIEIAALLGRALEIPVRVAPIAPDARVATLMRSGLPEPLAEIVAELFESIASGRVTPQGDRRIAGETRVADLLPVWVRQQAALAPA